MTSTSVVKFKISNHKLMIEVGRDQTDNLSRESRLYKFCKLNQEQK